LGPPSFLRVSLAPFEVTFFVLWAFFFVFFQKYPPPYHDPFVGTPWIRSLRGAVSTTTFFLVVFSPIPPCGVFLFASFFYMGSPRRDPLAVPRGFPSPGHIIPPVVAVGGFSPFPLPILLSSHPAPAFIQPFVSPMPWSSLGS